MPKKSKKSYQNISAIYVPRFEEIWDDTELISQYDEILKEWKEGKLETNESDVANWRNPAPEPDSDEAPNIGPWVAVEPETYNPETAAKGNYVPDFHDFELTTSYDEALRGWKEERELERWKEVMETLQKFHLTGNSTNSEESKASPWVLVNQDEIRGKFDYATAEELVDDMDASNGFSGALEGWKEERMQTESGAEPKDNKQQQLSNDVQSKDTTPNPETSQSNQLRSEASTASDSCPTSSHATEPNSKSMDT